MKKILSFLLIFTFSASIVGTALPVYATEATQSEGLYQYEETDGGVKITKYTGEEDDVVIPSTLGGKPVVAIGENAFHNNFLESVIIPEGVETIEYQAFYYCRRLQSVDLPESLVNLNSYAFFSCYFLNTGNSQCYQDGIYYLDGWLLYTDGCGNNPVIREGTQKISSRAFVRDHEIQLGLKTESITLPNSIVYISPEAFWNFHTEEFIMEDGGTHFKVCGGVLYTADGMELVKYPTLNERTSYSISDTTQRIQNYAFAGCHTLSAVGFPNSLHYIGDSAFEEVWYLSEATLNGIVEIGNGAFRRSGLQSVNFGGALKSVGNEAFYSVPLSAIDFPASVSNIGAGALGGCSDLISITVHDSNRYYNDDEIALYDADFKKILQFPIGLEAKSYTINERVEVIGGKAFEGCELEEVKLPPNVKTIEYDAFKGSEYLLDIDLPYGVTTIESGAFLECYELKSVAFGESLKTIGDDAFSCCASLEKIELPATVETIGVSAFVSCTNMETADLGGNVTNIEAGAFKGCAKLRSIDLGTALKEIKGGTFDHCLALEELSIPANTLLIDEWAFYETTNLKQFTVAEDNPNYCDIEGVLFNKQKSRLINFPSDYQAQEYTTPDGVAEIGEWAFACCKVPTVNLSYSLYFIGEYAFCDPRGITKLYINNKNCQIFSSSSLDSAITLYGFEGSTTQSFAESYGFNFEIMADSETRDYEYEVITADGTLRITKYNGSATDVVVPETIDGVTVSSIGDTAFMGNTTIQTLALPDSVYKIQSNAFRDCTSLETVSAPGVTILRECAFYDCANLSAVSFSENLEYIGENAFRNCGITEFSWPAAVEKIERETFYGCKNLKSITIPEGVTTIGSSAFDSTALTSITLPSTVTSVMDYAFFWCESLAEIKVGDGIESIGVSAFHLTAHYNNADNWQGGVYYLGKYALDHNGEILPENAEIVNGTLLIADNAFAYCSNLKSLYIPESVVHFGERIFYRTENVVINGVKDGKAESFAALNGLEFAEVVKECSHQWDNGVVTTPPECFKAGEATFTCALCSKTKTEPIPGYTEHAFEEYGQGIPVADCTESVKYTVGCSHCQAEEIRTLSPAGHKWNGGTVTKASNCNTAGVKTFTCTKCDAVKTQSIPKKSHNYQTKTTKATLTKKGKTVKKCSACGKIESSTTIYAAKTVKLSAASYIYNGKNVKPKLTVKDSKGKSIPAKEYTVSGTKSAKKIGKYKITVKFKGNYSGTKTLYYTIKPKTVSGLKLKSTKKKQLSVSFKKDSSVSGYEIVYATNSKFTKGKKTVRISSYKTYKKTLKKLKSKKTCYVKVRAFKKNGKEIIYGSYSGVKSVKVK